MAHPHRMLLARRPGALEQAAVGLHLDIGAAEFAVVAALDLAAELRRHRHLAVADAEHRHAGVEDQLRGARRARLVDRFRAAGEDHRFRLHLAEGGLGLLERHDLAIDAVLAHAARNQLRHLAAEIDDQNLVMRRGNGGVGGGGIRGILWGCHGKELRDDSPSRNPERASPTPSYPAKAGYPVRRGGSVDNETWWNTGSPACAGDDQLRARRVGKGAKRRAHHR